MFFRIGTNKYKEFLSHSSLISWLTAKGPLWSGVVSLIDSTKQRLQSIAIVNGSIEYLSPQSRSNGGYGVILSVDSDTQVTLAAGYTLGAAGRCRLWDVTGTTHLDSGGVEWRRSAAVVTLPDTTGLAAGDVVYSDRLEVHDFAESLALEAALGTAFADTITITNRTTGAVILRRMVSGGAWVAREVDFTKVTATPNAVAASVAGSVVTVTAGHSITTLAKTLRVWNTTDGSLIADVASGAWSRSGNDITVDAVTAAAVAAALAGAKVVRIWVEGVSELCIGGATRAVQPLAASWAYFSGGLVRVGRLAHRWAGVYRRTRVAVTMSAVTAPANAGDRVMVGWALTSAQNKGGGIAFHGGGLSGEARESDSVVGVSAGSAEATASKSFFIAHSHRDPTGGSDYTYAGPAERSAVAVWGNPIPFAAYASAFLYTVTTLQATEASVIL